MNKQYPKAVLLDMDGVIYHGDTALPGALEFMRALPAVPHAFITNNPIRRPRQIADKLEKMGFKRPAENLIITSGEVTAHWLHKLNKNYRYFAIGAPGLHEALSESGQADDLHADYVVIGEGEGINYQQLTTAINLILKENATLIGTNPDTTVDAVINGQHRILPGGGSLIAPLVSATGVTPLFIGKPYPLLFEYALHELGTEPKNCLMIGDRPDTDILGADRLGMRTALVRTGRFAPQEKLPADCPQPDWDVRNLDELTEELKKAFPGWLKSCKA